MYRTAKYRLCYLAHPRTGSQATGTILVDKFQMAQKMGGAEHHAALQHRLPASWIVMTAVRNLFDLFVSWYFYQHPQGSKVLFDIDYIKRLFRYDEPRRATYFPIWGRAFGLHVPFSTHILRYENLEADLNAVLKLRDLGPVRLPKVNVSVHREGLPYQMFYSADLREFVENEFGEEMEELEYSW